MAIFLSVLFGFVFKKRIQLILSSILSLRKMDSELGTGHISLKICMYILSYKFM